MYQEGENVFYPMHGAGRIENIQTNNVLGKDELYYILRMPGEVRVMVPVAKADDLGIRPIIDKSKVNKVMAILETDETQMDDNWNKRYRDNMEKMKSGDIFEIADIVRNLSFKQKEKGLSTGEKKMLQNAKKILVSELTLSQSAPEEDMIQMVDNKINTSFNTYKKQYVVQDSIVKKFVPFEG